MTTLHEDPRVRRGMERQLELRRRLIDDGARPIGWKLGLGTAAAMERHGTSAPLVGFLTDRGLREPGSEVAVGGWAKPTAEPEIAVHVARDVPADGDRDAVTAAIGGFGVAIEVVDLGGGELEDILAGDLFQRHVVLGPATSGVALADLRGGEIRLGEDVQSVGDPLALVGDPVAALAHLATHLAAFGETVRAGEVLITGSIVPPLSVGPDQRLEYRLEPLGELALRFVA
ncbi:MAG TPA: fumarylacetoacetate hydrolase family protein [Solirubrobacteraceae bacterium]|nr:fumarylacetoacetate hydrolase family protein [Solirubrobacteraceae bacterium]